MKAGELEVAKRHGHGYREAMKFSSLKVLSLLSAGLFFAGCEPHSFEETQVLHGDHGGHHEGDGHGADHGEKGDGEEHGKGEAKADAHAPAEAHPAPAEARKTGL